MSSLVIDYLTPLLPKLSIKALGALNKDMQDKDEEDKRTEGVEIVPGMRHGAWGNDQIDKPKWMQFWQAVKDEIERRAGA